MRRLLSVLPVFFALACGEDSNTSIEINGTLGMPVHFDLEANIPVAEVSINGSTPRHFILDTGAQLVLIDSAFAKEIGFETGLLPKQLDTVEVSGLTFNHVPAVSYDLSELTGMLGVHIDGFLGANLFEHIVMAFDYKDQNVYFLEDDESALAIDARSDVEHDAKIVDGEVTLGFFMVQASFEGGSDTKQMLFDTGASASVMTKSAFDTLGIPMDRRRIPGLAGVGQVGDFMLDLVRTCKAVAGEAEVDNMILAVAPDSILSTARQLFPDLAGVLGYTFLREFLIVIDYDNTEARLYRFTQRPHINDQELVSVGLIPVRRSGRIFVGAVVPGSDAEAKGVMVDDEVLKIDGTDALPLSDQQLVDALAGAAGDEHALTLDRSHSEVSVTVRVEQLLPNCP